MHAPTLGQAGLDNAIDVAKNVAQAVHIMARPTHKNGQMTEVT